MVASKPVLVSSIAHKQIRSLVCSTLGSFTVGISTKQDLYVWGDYQASSLAIPTKLKLPSESRGIREVYASSNIAALLDKNNRLWTW